jgi:beta-galactosidase
MAPVWSGTLQVMDVPGMNYRTHLYDAVYKQAPQGFILGSETASTISSRGVYKFPVVPTNKVYHDDLQCSGYDMEYCSWSNLPEEDWILQEDRSWTIGEFVWTGFDYLGEPTPYDNYWPSRSSYFGIFDLAGLPKDRYYLYRSHWNKQEHTLHLLPHWNWEGHEGDTIPVFCYTDYDTAELFVNGKSMGKRTKTRDSKYDRFRLRWMDVTYETGELKVVAYNKDGSKAAEETIRTAGAPHHIVLEPDTKALRANGEDLSFVTVRVVDKNGNECPTANLPLSFKVGGKGTTYKAACNGDATSTESFTQPTMRTFNGELVVVVSATEQPGTSTLTVTGKGLASGKCTFVTK